MSPEEREALERLEDLLEALEERVKALEAMLARMDDWASSYAVLTLT